MKSKRIRGAIRLQSTASNHSYITGKNRRNDAARLELRKYDPRARQHVLYREVKA